MQLGNMKSFSLSNSFDEPPLLFHCSVGGSGEGDGMGEERWNERRRGGVWRGAPKTPNQVLVYS